MTLRLIFNPEQFPRNIGRKEWKCIYRWSRVVSRKIEKQIEQDIQNLIIYGTTMPEAMRADIIDKLVNPPVIIHDKQLAEIFK